jgi:hypothetical protein
LLLFLTSPVLGGHNTPDIAKGGETENIAEKMNDGKRDEKGMTDRITTEALLESGFTRSKSRGGTYEHDRIRIGKIRELFGISKRGELRFLRQPDFILGGKQFYMRKQGVVLGLCRTKSLSDSDDTTITATVVCNEKERLTGQVFRELGFREQNRQVFTHEGIVLQNVLNLLLTDTRELRMPAGCEPSINRHFTCGAPDYGMKIVFLDSSEREKGVDGKVSVRVEFKHELLN